MKNSKYIVKSAEKTREAVSIHEARALAMFVSEKEGPAEIYKLVPMGTAKDGVFTDHRPTEVA